MGKFASVITAFAGKPNANDLGLDWCATHDDTVGKFLFIASIICVIVGAMNIYFNPNMYKSPARVGNEKPEEQAGEKVLFSLI